MAQMSHATQTMSRWRRCGRTHINVITNLMRRQMTNQHENTCDPFQMAQFGWESDTKTTFESKI